jgi:hypothetical protein
MLFRALLLLWPVCAVAADASGRHWRLSIERVTCEGSTLAIGSRIRYLGPKGPVEAPLSDLTDGQGKRHPPKSLVWKAGARQYAAWLSAGGGLTDLQSEEIGEFQLNFELREAAADLRLEFGDIPAFALTRKRKTGCEGVLAASQIQAPRVARRTATEKSSLRIYRAAYPCSGGPSVEASHPPYLPRRLLVFGRGYLPNAREVELPMGRAPAQSYVYAGPDELKPLDEATRRAAAGFTEGRTFLFSWGMQKAASGNEAYSVGVYDLRPCPK